jgi:predicted TIM-barrel fold metal-dependent hydrolase
MIIDFHHHYTPLELMRGSKDGSTVRLDEKGNPNYRFNAELADLPAHVRMMDKAGIDVAVLSCGEGFDQPNLATCRLINDRMHQAERDHPDRFVGLAHVPALNPQEAALELKRCAVELGFPGAVIASELQGQSLDADGLRPFWKAAADLGLYIFIHPLPRVISWGQMEADDLGRMLGWEFSLMVTTVRLINSGLLDELPSLTIQISHFAGGISRYLPRIHGLQSRGITGGPKSRLITICIIDCSTIVPGGQVPIRPQSGVPNGFAPGFPSCRRLRSCLRPTILRPCATMTRSLHT